MSATTEVN